MAAVIIGRATTWAGHRPGNTERVQPPCWRCRRHCRRLVVSAGLLDLLRGGSSGSESSLAGDADGEALKSWMEARGLPPQKLTAVAVPGAGRGLAAAHAINKGEPLLRIPAQLVVTPAFAAQQSSLAPLLEQFPLPAWSVLALWLAEARAAGPAGEFWPYIRLLPQQTGCVLEWSEQEVGWLAGSQLHAVAREIRGAADASWAELQPLLAEAERRGTAPPAAFSRDALQWAFSILLSRLVRLPSLASPGAAAAGAPTAQPGQQQQQQQQGDPPGTEVLLPFADLLNHSPGCSAFLDWSEADAGVVLRADRRYRPGEEVFISYGQKSGGELLLSYGFCPRPADNPHDGCKLRLSLRSGDPAAEWKAAALAQHGFPASHLFPLRMAAAPFELVHYAALVAAEVGSQQEAEVLAAQLFGPGGEIPPALQPAALETVVAACQAALKSFPRSFDEDRAELDRLEAAAEHPAAAEQQRQQRRRQVLQATVYERQVLSRTAFILQQELKDLRRMARAR